MSLMYHKSEFTNRMSVDEIARRCPAAFTQSAIPAASDRYSFVDTSKAISILNDTGFHVSGAKQKQSRLSENIPFQDHLISFAPNEGGIESDLQSNVILYNSHNARSKMMLMCGVFRFTCDNSLIAGEGFKTKLSHVGLTESAFEKMLRTVIDSLPKMLQTIEAMRQTKLDQDQVIDLAYNAAKLRWDIVNDQNPLTGKDTGHYAVHNESDSTLRDITAVRRPGDADSDCFTVYNRIQEAVLLGGDKYRNRVNVLSYNKDKDRSVWKTARPVNAIDKAVKLNQDIWTLAENMVAA